MFAKTPGRQPVYDEDFVVNSTSNTLTIGGSGVLTTASITVNSGDPWRYNNTATGLELEGIGGTWLMPAASSKIALQSAGGTVSDWYVFANSSTLDLYPKNITAPIFPGSGISTSQEQRHVLRLFNDAGTSTVMRMDMLGAITWGNFVEPYDTSASGETGGVGKAGGGWTGASATASINPHKIAIHDPASGATDHWSAASPGAVSCDNLLSNRDVHAQRNMYGVNKVITGARNELTTHQYALQVNSGADPSGGDYAPIVGYQTFSLWTDTFGTHYTNHDVADPDYEGEDDTAFWFDDAIYEVEKRVLTAPSITAGSGITLVKDDTAGTVEISADGPTAGWVEVFSDPYEDGPRTAVTTDAPVPVLSFLYYKNPGETTMKCRWYMNQLGSPGWARAYVDVNGELSAVEEVVSGSPVPANTTVNVSGLADDDWHSVTVYGYAQEDTEIPDSCFISQFTALVDTPIAIGGGGGGSGVSSISAGTGISVDTPTGSVTVSATLGNTVDLESEVTGVTPPINGGTGLATPGTKNNVLTSDGSGNWVSQPVAIPSLDLQTNREICFYAHVGGTLFDTFGVGTSQVAGNPSNNDQSDHPFVRYQSSGGVAAVAGTRSVFLGSGFRFTWPCTYFGIIRTDSSVADVILWSGVGGGQSGSITDPSSSPNLMFRYASTVDSGTGNWRAYNSDGSASTETDTGIAAATDTTFEFRIEFTPGVEAKFFINGTLVATHTTDLPTGGGQILSRAIQQTGTAKAMSISRMSVYY